MMTNNMKSLELNEMEMENVSGGLTHTMREMKIKLEEEFKKAQETQKTQKQGAQAHDSGASGSW